MVGAHPLLGEAPKIVEPEDVHEFPHHVLAVGERTDRGLRELADEGALDPGLTGEEFPSTTTIPRRIERRSKAARIDPK